MSIYTVDRLDQNKEMVRLFLWLEGHMSAYLPLDLKQPLYWVVHKKWNKHHNIMQADRP